MSNGIRRNIADLGTVSLMRPRDEDIAVHGVRWRFLVDCLTLMSTAVAWSLDSGIVFSSAVFGALAIMHLLCMVMFIWLPIPACVLCLIEYLAMGFVVPDYSGMLSLGVMTCMAYLAYRLRTWAALGCFLCVWVAEGVAVVVWRSPVSDLGPVFLVNAIAFLIGTLFAYRGRLSRDRRLANNMHMAGALHDAVTGELSAIALLSQSAFVDGAGECADDGDIRKRMREIHELSLAALHNTHEVIRLLHETTDDKDTGDDIGNGIGQDVRIGANTVIGRYLDEQTRRLDALGFRGTVDDGLQESEGELSSTSQQLIMQCVGELCANIARHADHVGGYSLTLEMRGSEVLIEQRNMVAEENDVERRHPELRSGFGLGLLKTQIEAQGGRMHCHLQQGEWHIEIHIPQ